jgi:hypothetical protein
MCASWSVLCKLNQFAANELRTDYTIQHPWPAGAALHVLFVLAVFSSRQVPRQRGDVRLGGVQRGTSVGTTIVPANGALGFNIPSLLSVRPEGQRHRAGKKNWRCGDDFDWPAEFSTEGRYSMIYTTRWLLFIRQFLLTCLSTAFVLAIGTVPVRAESVIGLTSANSLVTFDSLTPGVVSAAIPITGVGAETIFDIDRRPANGLLYGLGSAGNLYLIKCGGGGTDSLEHKTQARQLGKG